MAEIKMKNLIVEIGDKKYKMIGSRLEDICEELGISEDRFIELLSRDAYCPTLSAAPTSSTLTYVDTDGSTNHFHVGQLCRWAEGNDYRLAVCKDATETAVAWHILPTKVSELTNDANYVKSEDLSSVATSGNYNDLSNKPTIPSAVTESTVSGWGFTKNTGTYTKPSTGIPKTDLDSAVQTSLGRADTALQSHQDISGKINGDGTITSIVKVTSLPSSPNANTLYVIV